MEINSEKVIILLNNSISIGKKRSRPIERNPIDRFFGINAIVEYVQTCQESISSTFYARVFCAKAN